MNGLKIVCLGGGPASLYFSLLMKKANPGHDITVLEHDGAVKTRNLREPQAT